MDMNLSFRSVIFFFFFICFWLENFRLWVGWLLLVFSYFFVSVDFGVVLLVARILFFLLYLLCLSGFFDSIFNAHYHLSCLRFMRFCCVLACGLGCIRLMSVVLANNIEVKGRAWTRWGSPQKKKCHEWFYIVGVIITLWSKRFGVSRVDQSVW